MKKAIILGAQGQLGSEINQVFKAHQIETITPTHAELDIVYLKQVEEFLRLHRPDVVINTTAYHNVDLCETNPQLALDINATAPAFIARMCFCMGTKFVHFSTDYVFDGSKKSPYNELDKPNPVNMYGKTKLQGERDIVSQNPNALILRVSALYGKNPCRAKNGMNFVQLMLKLAHEKPELNVVGDEIVSPTSTVDIARILPSLIEQDLKGIVHLTSEGECSWHEFASAIFELTDTKVKLNKVDSSFFPSKTPRPQYSVLENTLIKNKGMTSLPHWKDALAEYLKHLN